MSTWQYDKRWSDVFLPEIKQILGLYLIGEPPVEEDQERNTDLMVLKMDAVRVGCRIRRNQYLVRYQNEFTIRSGRPSGTKTELTKIIEGWGDYFFYGFADVKCASLAAWKLCDMKVFRIWLMRELGENKKMPGIHKNNADDSSSFEAFSFLQMPIEFVVAESKANEHS